MRLRIPVTFAANLSLLFAVAFTSQIQAQSGCARCVAPPIRSPRNLSPSSRPDVATRYRADRARFEETPPVPTPFYGVTQDSDSAEPSLFQSRRGTAPVLIPTDPVVPSGTERAPTEKPRVPAAPGSQRTITEKIALRYGDPRVVRMLQQLNASSVESLYSEVSELIDGRHLVPAAYARRVDNALDHLIQAVEIPAFQKAADVQGTPEQIATFQQELQELRTRIKVKSNVDALAALRNVQLTAAQSIDINAAAIGLEFVYGATDSLDQFSMLLPPEKNGGPSVGLRDNVVGIGVEVEPTPEGLKIVKLLPGGPAAQADLRRGDVITHADGTKLKELDLNRAVEYIVGPEGTAIEIQAARGHKTGRVTLVRQKIAIHSVVDVHMADTAQGIGYLKLEQFADSSIEEFDAALVNLHQQGMKSLVVDLRGNPGGLLTTAIALSDRFLPAGTIVSTRGRTAADNSRETAQYDRTWKVPLVVLIDHNSASASEIFAAAIQDNGRGLVVGEKSYGKGTVQTLFPLQTFPAALRLTTAKFYSPRGREMAGVGVTPDVKVSSAAAESNEEDPVLKEGLRQIVDPRIKEMAENFRRMGNANDDDSNVAA